jgi:hypothetical protein
MKDWMLSATLFAQSNEEVLSTRTNNAFRAGTQQKRNLVIFDPIVADIAKQILRVTEEDLKSVPRLRNPVLE